MVLANNHFLDYSYEDLTKMIDLALEYKETETAKLFTDIRDSLWDVELHKDR
jgi:hypothetical protein